MFWDGPATKKAPTLRLRLAAPQGGIFVLGRPGNKKTKPRPKPGSRYQVRCDNIRTDGGKRIERGRELPCFNKH
ncbi:hypothetical protein GCM10027288_04990 [Bordetella tumbae]